MIIKSPHPFIDQPNTYLTASAAASATSVTVANNAEFSANDYTVLGVGGQEGAELHKVSGVSGNTTINYSGDALKFGISINTNVTYIKYNQVKFYLGDWSARYSTGKIAVTRGSAVVTGTGTSWGSIDTTYALLLNGKWYDIYSADSATQLTLTEVYDDESLSSSTYSLVAFTVQTTVNIAIDQLETLWDDTDALAEDYYRTAYYNSTSLAVSGKSSIISATEDKGFSEFSLLALEDQVLTDLQDPEASRFSRAQIKTDLDDALREFINVIVSDVQEDYLSTYRTLDLTTSGEEPLFNDFRRLTSIWVSYNGVDYIKAMPMEVGDDLPNVQYSESQPMYYLRDNVIGIKPTPTAAVANGAKIWYQRRIPSFRYEGDEIPFILRDFKRLFIDYALSKELRADDQKKSEGYALDVRLGKELIVKGLKDRDEFANKHVEIVQDFDLYS